MLALDGLSQLQVVPPDSTVTPFPLALIPIYEFSFLNDNTDTIWQLVDGHTPDSIEISTMWKTRLDDGPFANLTSYGQRSLQAIYDKESHSGLSFLLEGP